MIDISIITIFLIANLVIGILSSRNIFNLDQFSVGNRSFSSFAICATLTASFIGGGYTIGNAAKVFSSGMIYAFALLGFSLKEILVATLIAPRMDKYRDCLSIGDMMAKRYGQTIKIITGVFSLLICAGILGAQVGAMGAIFKTFLHVPVVWGIIIGFGIIIIYSSLGGMRAVVYTDILQFLILIIGIPLAFVIGIHDAGGVHHILQTVPKEHIHFLQNTHQIILFIGLFVTFIFGETLVPPYVQRLFMAKSARHTRNATLSAGLISIPFFLIAGGLGLIALVLKPSLDPNLAIPYVVDTVLPVAIRGFVIAGILSIIMSSAAGFLNAAAIAFVNDIVRPLSGDNFKRQNMLLKLAKSITFFVGIGAVLFALTIKNVLDILLYAYNFWSPIILVPLLVVIFNVKAKPKHFYFGACGGIISMLIWSLALHEPFHISSIIIGVTGNLICFIGSNYLESIIKFQFGATTSRS